LLVVFAVAFFAVCTLFVFALLIGTARLRLARFALLVLVRLLGVIGHEDTSSVARPCALNATFASSFLKTAENSVAYGTFANLALLLRASSGAIVAAA
jgi:hypothetical protein